MATETPAKRLGTLLGAARRRYASEGPLKHLIPVFVDVETYLNERKGISLGSMTLRQYIKNSHLTSIAIAIGDSEVQVWLCPDGNLDPAVIQLLKELAEDDNYIFVAHNAAFDIRVLRFMLGIPQPKHVWCTVEGAMGAWPECVGGYSLKALGLFLNLPDDMRKIDVEEIYEKTLEQLSGHQLAEYNARDVKAMREVYYFQIACLPENEQWIAMLTHGVRKYNFLVDPDALSSLIEKLDLNANDAQEGASDLLSMEELAEVFNRNTADGSLRSIRVARLQKLIREKWNVTLPTTSLKKLSPVIQAKYPEITTVLRHTGRANKMLSHGRRSKIFRGIPEVDVELGYFRAHTGRFSSPSSGKGLNLHNVPKHDKSVAEPIRRVFRMPPDKCLVRGDLANVEFRVEGYLTDAREVIKMFDAGSGGSIFNDPYCLSWKAMTSILIEKKDPVRQVAKSAVLGLGYCLDGDTPVPTLAGIKRLKDLIPGEAVWNGRKWVKAGGALKTGRKKCIRLGNTWLTEDHQVWWNGWRRAGEIATSAAIQLHRLEQSSVAGLFVPANTQSELSDAYRAVVSATQSLLVGSISSTGAEQSNAEDVPIHDAGNAAEILASTAASFLTRVLDAGGSPLSTTALPDVEMQTTRNITTTEVEESNFDSLRRNGFITSLPYQDGTTGRCFWIGSTTTDTTNLEICVSSRLPSLSETGDLLVEERDVYDLLDVEYGHCFQAGDWLVHNCMGGAGYAKVLLGVLADKTSNVTDAKLYDMAMALNWKKTPRMNWIIEQTNCSEIVAIASYHIHRLFNEAYPEFARTADWLYSVIEHISRGNGEPAHKIQYLIDKAYTQPRAPDRNKIGLELDPDDTEGVSVRVRCGPWTPTICWRQPLLRSHYHDNVATPKLTILKATGEQKLFTKQLAIENVTQSAARNALCYGVLELKRRGIVDVLHIHDEVMIITDRKREAVLEARRHLLEVFGPGNRHPLGWAILVKPEEVTITESMWEDEVDVKKPELNKKTGKIEGNDRWGKIERNEPAMFAGLT